MPIHVYWDTEEHTIVRYDFIEPWAWPDLLAAIDASNAMLDSVDYKVHFIHDISTITVVPVDTLSHLRSFVDKEHPNTGRSIVVGGSQSTILKILKGMFTLIYKLYQKDWGFSFADTVEEAHQTLSQYVTKKV